MTVKQAARQAKRFARRWDGAMVYRERRYLGLSQSKFAEKIGCYSTTVSKWENGWHLPSNLAIKSMRELCQKNC